ncbi:MAG TPA: methyltransferase domain-containing protein [bacterium]|nr:methyltransferase domain-containing protein [bacterium]
MDEYAFDPTWIHARQRLRGLEQLLDAGTIRRLEALGVAEGWHCLEVGAGGGSIAEWLCQRVGRAGYVMATDLDTRFLGALTMPNLDTRRHDIASDDLPERRFDLVLSRLVLEHIQEREKALRRMLSALKPGGWLVCEDTDNVTVALVSPTDAASSGLFMKVEQGKDRVMAARGHVYCGPHLYGFLCALGLTDVHVEGRVPLLHSGTAATHWKRLSVEQLRKDIVHAQLATEAEIEAYFALLDSPTFVAWGFTVMTAWGRRPSEHGPALLSKSDAGNG